jgi:hypothetical protein
MAFPKRRGAGGQTPDGGGGATVCGHLLVLTSVFILQYRYRLNCLMRAIRGILPNAVKEWREEPFFRFGSLPLIEVTFLCSLALVVRTG